MITADYHVHSDFSSDSQASMESMVEQAIALGLERICFTDHMDYEFPKQYHYSFEFDVDAYFEKVAQLKQTYQRKIQILCGIECGMRPSLSKRFQKLIASYPFDFVICSSHLVNDMDPYYEDFWKEIDKETGLSLYFDSILSNIRSFDNFDVYGHLDYIIRYVPNKDTTYKYEDYKEQIDEILMLLIQKGKGIEINTAGFKYGLGTAHPCAEIVKRYFELGGTILTIGSDGHKPEHLAYDFERARTWLQSLGVTRYTVFEQRTPIFLPL